MLYRVSQKSGTVDFQYFAIHKCCMLWGSLDKTSLSSTFKNGIKIIEFSWVVFDSVVIS